MTPSEYNVKRAGRLMRSSQIFEHAVLHNNGTCIGWVQAIDGNNPFAFDYFYRGRSEAYQTIIKSNNPLGPIQ